MNSHAVHREEVLYMSFVQINLKVIKNIMSFSGQSQLIPFRYSLFLLKKRYSLFFFLIIDNFILENTGNFELPPASCNCSDSSTHLL